jgi:hypothetical protein
MKQSIWKHPLLRTGTGGDADRPSAPAVKPMVCRKKCGEGMRSVCYLSNACRLAVIPLVWWGIVGFGSGLSGVSQLQAWLGLSVAQSAALMAVLLGAVSMFTLLPCGIHKRIMRSRRGQCCGPVPSS